MQRLRLNRHTEDWQPGVTGDNSGQMRRAAGAGDDDTQSARCCFAREIGRRLGRAMGGEDPRFVRHTKLIECFNGVAHRLPIRFAPHYDRNQRFRLRHEGIVGRLIRSRQFALPSSFVLVAGSTRLDVDLLIVDLQSHIAIVNSARSIVLIGMMGAGKSSVGRCLQRRTGLARFDTDEMVASNFDLSIPEIFSKHGEQRFRDAETQALRELSLDRQAIVVTGGGIVLRSENSDLLKRLGVVVWLEAPANTLFERASRKGNRPLLQTENPRQALSEMLQTRTPLYTKVSDIRIDTSRLSHDEVADAILSEIEASSAKR
jgi:shikimate kinase